MMADKTPCCVPLERRPGSSPCRFLPDKDRTREGIDTTLAETLRAVIAGESPWPLVMLGSAGGGKTCAALVVVDVYGGMYATVGDWCQRVRDAEFGDLRTSAGFLTTRYELWRDWSKANVVVLDEIGARMDVTDAHYDYVKRAIDLREGCPAIFISNLTLEALGETYDDRIASRLSAGTRVELTGDRRQGPRG